MVFSNPTSAANRRDARAPGGDPPSRADALQQALCSAAFVPESHELVRSRMIDFFGTLKPQNHFHCWLVTEASLLTIRIDRAERIERRIRDKMIIRADHSWDDGRRIEAAVLGEALPGRPEVVLEQLRKTPHGCDWLMGRWAMLAYSAEAKGSWTAEQERLAFDLLATPAEFRQGHKPGTMIDLDGRPVEGPDDPAAVARRAIAALKARRAVVEGLDKAERALAGSDLSDEVDPELRRLRRYEASLFGRLRWCMALLRFESPHEKPAMNLFHSWIGTEANPNNRLAPAPRPIPGPEAVADADADWPAPPPSPEARPEPEPTPEPEPRIRVQSIRPPFDLEPGEDQGEGIQLDFPAILAAREAKKRDESDARRNDRRRKLERLRG